MNVIVSGGGAKGKNKGKNKKGKQKKDQSLHISVGSQKGKNQGKEKRKGPRAPSMTECARKYLAAIARPFSSEAMGSCLPYQPDRDSLKATALARFTLTLSGSGDGWVLFTPTTVNDYMSVIYSNTGATIPITMLASNTAPANTLGIPLASLPFGAPSLNTNVDGRIVSVGFRMTYLGSVSNMSGYFFSYSEPSHSNVNKAEYTTTTAGVFSALECKLQRVSQTPFEQGFTVVGPEEHPYRGQNSYTSVGTANNLAFFPWSQGVDINGVGPTGAGYLNNGAPPIIFGVKGAFAGALVLVEIIEHVEYVGKGASYGLTPSHNDDQAANKISAAADRAQGEFIARPEESWASTMSRSLGKVLREQQTPMGKAAMGAAVRVASTYLSRRPRGSLRLNV